MSDAETEVYPQSSRLNSGPCNVSDVCIKALVVILHEIHRGWNKDPLTIDRWTRGHQEIVITSRYYKFIADPLNKAGH